MNRILVTMGDAAGISVEIILKSFQYISDANKYTLIGNKDIFYEAEKQFNLKLPDNLEFININYDIHNIQTGIEIKIQILYYPDYK